MKAKKRISKKLLSLLLSLLMVVTTIPLVVIPATAATTGTLNPSSWQAVCGTSNSARADGTRVVVTSDGEAGNSSVGLIKFPISGVPDGVTNATLNVQATNHGGSLANSTVQVHSVDPSKFNASVTSGVVANSSAFGNTYNSNTMATNVYSYFGCSSSTSLGTITQSNPRTYNFDITSAMNAAKSAGQNELCLLFMMPQCYNDNNGNTWSDVNIIIAGTNIAYSYDTTVPTVPTGIFPASVVENTNKSTLSHAQACNTAVTTIHGNFSNDDSYMTDDYYNQIYKNVLYSPTKSASGSDSDYAVLLNAQCYWNNYYARWFHAETVMMYDGETTPSTGIMMFYASSKNAWNGNGHTHLLSSYISEGTGNGLVLQDKWHAADSGRNSNNTVRLNMQYTWFGKPATVNNFRYTQSTGNYTGYFDNSGKENSLANIIRYTGSMGDTEWSKTIYPTYGFFAKTHDNANCTTDWTDNNQKGEQKGRSSVPFHIINYKPLKAAINKANDLITAVNANPSKYDPTWVRSLVIASNALMAAKPNNFVNANKKDVAGYASAAKTAVEQFNAVAKPYTDSNDLSELATYTVTFKNGYTGDTISSANYKYGQTPTAPSFQLTKRTYAGTPQHSSNYEWSSVISAVTDNTDYTQNVTSWKNCNFSIITPIETADCTKTGSEKQTCSVCGAEKTVTIQKNPDNHADYGTYVEGAKAATCTEAGATGDVHCNGCHDIITASQPIAALGHNYEGVEWTITTPATWNTAGEKQRECTRCDHVDKVEIPALGDHDLPTATATVVIDNQDRSNDAFSTDPVKYYPDKNQKVPVKITASDATSGIKEVRYYISDSVLTLEQAEAQNYNRTLTLDSNGFAKLPNDLGSSTDKNFIVYFKIVDGSGNNVTYVNTPMVVFDVTDPTITLTGNGKADETEFCEKVNVKVEDTNLKTVTVNGEEKTLENGRFTADLTAGEYTVVATDMTGNSTTKTFTVNASHTGGTATCQNHATCAVCGQGYGEKNPDNHVNLTHHEGQDATCTKDGWTEYDECVCGAIIGKTTLPKYDHDQKRYVSNDDGTHKVVCDRCSETIETSVACLGDETGGHKAATCTEPAKREHECANCHYKYWVNEEGSVPTGHKYNDTAVFNWTSSDVDGVKVWTCDTATFTCAVDGCGHTEEVAVTPTHVTTDAKCGVAGSVVYTATATLNYTFMGVSVPATATEKQEVTLPALEHVWGDVSFVWNTAEDGTVSCTASRTCANGHTDSLDVTLTHEQTTVPTCTIKEVVTYTAEVTVDGAKKTDTYEVEGAVDSSNHSYVDVVTPPTCTTDGYTTHTCSACGDTYTDSKVGMLGHDWDDPVFTWADDNTCTATKTCKRAGCGTEEPVNVVVTHDTTTPATCTEKEVVTYTATATIGDKNYTSTKDVIGEIDPNNHDWVLTGKTDATCEDNEVEHYECSRCPETKNETVEGTATGHNWDTENATFTWTKTEDGSSYTATATRTCKNDTKHTETVNAVISEPVIDPDATCETEGKVTFTATATFSTGDPVIGTKVDTIAALRHDYGKAEFVWSADHMSATATKTCSHDATHVLTAEVKVEVNVTADCTNAGEKIYKATATFTDGSTATAEFREDVGALGHDWNEPTFDWTADKDSATCTATFVCKTDDSHVKTVNVENIKRTEEAATCTADGKVTYTVEGFTFEGKAYDVPAKEVTLKKLGHAYGDYTIADADRPTKNEDGTWTNGTLRAVCANGCGIEATKTIGRADYTKYDKAWNDLVTLRDRDDVNAEIKAEIQAVLDANVIAQNLVALENEQKTIDDATAKLVYELEEAEKKISYTVTFKDEDGNVVYTELVLKGEDVKNVPAVPAKAPDKDNHYIGKWNGATTNIQFNETVHAVYTAEAHRGGTATCVSGKKCEVCGTEYTDASQDGHDWELHFFWAQDYSKCEAKVVCKNCGFETVEVLEAKVTKEENPATCTAEGSITYTATVSYQGETRTSVRTEILKPTGHKYGKPTFNWNADHECKAWKTCASCGNRLMADNVDVVYSKVERTCEIEGFDVYTATATFGTETYENVKKISLGFAEHQFGETYLIKESTCTEQGLEGRKCSVCGAVTATKLPIKEHQPKTIPGYAATCTKAGLTDGIICAECSYAIKAQEIIPALGHIDENNDGVCDRCGTHLGIKPPVEPENDGCICHREGNIFGKIIRIICTVLSGVFHKDIKCCPDMEWWSTKKG